MLELKQLAFILAQGPHPLLLARVALKLHEVVNSLQLVALYFQKYHVHLVFGRLLKVGAFDESGVLLSRNTGRLPIHAFTFFDFILLQVVQGRQENEELVVESQRFNIAAGPSPHFCNYLEVVGCFLGAEGSDHRWVREERIELAFLLFN